MGKAGIYFYKTAIANRAMASMDTLIEVWGGGVGVGGGQNY